MTQDQLLATWDPFTFAILTEVAGHVKFQDLKEGVTFDEEVDEVTGQSRMVVKDSPDEKKQPRLEIRNASNKVLKTYQMPVRANLMVDDGEDVEPGDIIAKIPRETTKTKDITGGLPRVVELFEARRPAETAVMSEIDGTVKLGPISKGKRKLIITGDDGEEREYDIPRGTHINVQEGDRVRAGEALMDGPLNPHDILRVLGMQPLAGISRQRNSGGLSPAGREHQRQAHRSDRSSDAALGEDQGSRRHRLPARGAGRSFPLHGRERARATKKTAKSRRPNRCCSESRRRRSRPIRSSRRRRSRRRRAC